jgi:hypothetical protein
MPARPSIASPAAGPDDSSVAFLHAVLDDVIALYGSEPHTGAALAARKEYHERRDRVFEDQPLWEAWTQAFLEWYVIERPHADAPDAPGAPPAARYLAPYLASIDPGDERRRTALRAWLTSYRSLFEVRALRAGQVELVDLLGGGQFLVDEQRALAGVSVGDVAELRLIGFEDRVRFGKTFCFHPAGTRDAIVTHARRMVEQGHGRRDIMDLCARLRVRCERYRHVSPVRVYQTAPSTLARASAPMVTRERASTADPADEDMAR